MKKLQILYIDHVPHVPTSLPPNVVEVYIGASGEKLDVYILRNGFIIAENAMEAIAARLHQLDKNRGKRGRSLAQDVGLCPVVNAEWRSFFGDLLQRDDAWAFLAPINGAQSVS